MLKNEKSCGALIYRKPPEGKTQLLVLKHKFGGHWSFPKGHMEAGETERQTALREVKEETGLDIRIREGFHQSVQYFPMPGIRKQVVYFLAEAMPGQAVPQEEEISEIRWIDLDKALDTVTFRNDKNLVRAALAALKRDDQRERPARIQGAGQSHPRKPRSKKSPYWRKNRPGRNPSQWKGAQQDKQRD